MPCARSAMAGSKRWLWQADGSAQQLWHGLCRLLGKWLIPLDIKEVKGKDRTVSDDGGSGMLG